AASVSIDGTLKVWNLHTGQAIATHENHAFLLCCAITADGQTLLAGDDAGTLHIVELRNAGSKHSLVTPLSPSRPPELPASGRPMHPPPHWWKERGAFLDELLAGTATSLGRELRLGTWVWLSERESRETSERIRREVESDRFKLGAWIPQ